MTTTTGRSAALGLIGLGTMGAPMAGHLLAARGELHVTARHPASASDVVGHGATWHPSARGVAASAATVVLMVPDLPQVRELLDGPDGLLAGLDTSRGDELLLVISSTSSPQGVRDLDTELRARSADAVRVVDAPVSGGEEGAVAGTLAILVGGPDDDAARACAALAPCGRPEHLGPLGAGQVAKACNQMIVAATVLALGEASVLAERAGLDVGRLLPLLGSGYAGSRVLDVKARRFAEHDHSPSGAARFMVKDLTFASEEAARTGTGTPQLDVLRESFTALTDAGLGDQDTAVVQAWIEGLRRI